MINCKKTECMVVGTGNQTKLWATNWRYHNQAGTRISLHVQCVVTDDGKWNTQIQTGTGDSEGCEKAKQSIKRQEKLIRAQPLRHMYIPIWQ